MARNNIDIKLTQDEFGAFDLTIEDGDFVGVEGFDTALNLSLLTDARAPQDKVPTPEKRRGWMGDLNSPVTGRLIGSLLWLLEQRRLVQGTLNDAVSFTRDALNWFVEDGIAKDVAVSGVIVPRQGIALTIVITTLDGRTETHYVPLWEVTGQ